MSMVRIYKHKDKWVAEEEGYGYPTLRNFYSKFDDAVDYASSSLKYNYKNSPEVYEEGVVEIGQNDYSTSSNYTNTFER